MLACLNQRNQNGPLTGVTKLGSLVDNDTFNLTKPSIYNDGSDNVVELTYSPQEPRDLANNVTTDVAVTSVPQDELFDYDDISAQSVEKRT